MVLSGSRARQRNALGLQISPDSRCLRLSRFPGLGHAYLLWVAAAPGRGIPGWPALTVVSCHVLLMQLVSGERQKLKEQEEGGGACGSGACSRGPGRGAACPSVVHSWGRRAVSICSQVIQTLPLSSVPFSCVLHPFPFLIPAFFWRSEGTRGVWNGLCFPVLPTDGGWLLTQRFVLWHQDYSSVWYDGHSVFLCLSVW